MILKASQRGGPRQLAAHLLNIADNEHVTLMEVRGFISGDLYGAMAETVAIAKGTRCVQPIFSMSLNPPKEVAASVDQLIEAVERAEQAVGLVGQPRAIVIHEKNGRRHAHAVWSRIDADSMKAVNLPHFKNKLARLSKELYLEHGWELPDGHKENGWKNPLNFTLAEWQQASRIDLDPREIKQVFQHAWRASDNLASFKGALEHHGFYLAKGDRRGLVAIDVSGEVFSIARWTGLKSKEVNARATVGVNLGSVDDTRARIAKLRSEKFKEKREELQKTQEAAILPLRAQLRMLVKHHRKERSLLADRQARRAADEARTRAAKFRRGLGMVMDVLTGRLFTQRKENERDALECFIRDRQQAEELFRQQQEEKEKLHRQLETMRQSQRTETRSFIKGLVAKRGLVRNRDRDGPTLSLS